MPFLLRRVRAQRDSWDNSGAASWWASLGAKKPAELMDELRVGQALCIKWVRAIQGSEFLLDRCRVTIQSIQRTGEVIAVFTPGDGQTRPLAGDLAEACP